MTKRKESALEKENRVIEEIEAITKKLVAKKRNRNA